jgi:cold shock CspA family protein
MDHSKKLTRIGVFYDGNYFLHVSNYYNYFHERQSRISIGGLHKFIRHQIALEEDTDTRLCQIVDAHYFRGRLNARDASQKGDQLYFDRVFDDILMSEGVTTHYLPIRNHYGSRFDREIDVWLALEAFEMASYKHFDILVLIASDGDYVPLIRKLNTLGTRVMVVSWDFEYFDDEGRKFSTRTSQDLLQEVTYPIALHEVIEEHIGDDEGIINDLFVPRMNGKSTKKQADLEDESENISTVVNLNSGYGFIRYQPENLFFHYNSLIDYDFNDLEVGDKVQFKVEQNEKGQYYASEVTVIE